MRLLDPQKDRRQRGPGSEDAAVDFVALSGLDSTAVRFETLAEPPGRLNTDAATRATATCTPARWLLGDQGHHPGASPQSANAMTPAKWSTTKIRNGPRGRA